MGRSLDYEGSLDKWGEAKINGASMPARYVAAAHATPGLHPYYRQIRQWGSYKQTVKTRRNGTGDGSAAFRLPRFERPAFLLLWKGSKKIAPSLQRLGFRFSCLRTRLLIAEGEDRRCGETTVAGRQPAAGYACIL